MTHAATALGLAVLAAACGGGDDGSGGFGLFRIELELGDLPLGEVEQARVILSLPERGGLQGTTTDLILDTHGLPIDAKFEDADGDALLDLVITFGPDFPFGSRQAAVQLRPRLAGGPDQCLDAVRFSAEADLRGAAGPITSGGPTFRSICGRGGDGIFLELRCSGGESCAPALACEDPRPGDSTCRTADCGGALPNVGGSPLLALLPDPIGGTLLAGWVDTATNRLRVEQVQPDSGQTLGPIDALALDGIDTASVRLARLASGRVGVVFRSGGDLAAFTLGADGTPLGLVSSLPAAGIESPQLALAPFGPADGALAVWKATGGTGGAELRAVQIGYATAGASDAPTFTGASFLAAMPRFGDPDFELTAAPLAGSTELAIAWSEVDPGTNQLSVFFLGFDPLAATPLVQGRVLVGAGNHPRFAAALAGSADEAMLAWTGATSLFTEPFAARSLANLGQQRTIAVSPTDATDDFAFAAAVPNLFVWASRTATGAVEVVPIDRDGSARSTSIGQPVTACGPIAVGGLGASAHLAYVRCDGSTGEVDHLFCP